MNITLSLAHSRDLCIDDSSTQRLRLSTPEDWAEVYALRAQCDAILVGGETLRRDNPTLGLTPPREREPMRVIISGEGEIPPAAKIFHKGHGRVVIFSNIKREELQDRAEVITSEMIDIPFIITELEKRGITKLFVEGGAKILKMFLDSGVVNTLRVACNPSIEVNDPLAPHFDPSPWIKGAEQKEEKMCGGMRVTTYYFTPSQMATPRDGELMERTIANSRNSPARDSCYRVGALIESRLGEIFEGYTLEGSPTHHAEQVAISKALAAGAELRGATIYSSLEPCSKRSSEPKSCSELIIKHGFARVLFALYEPSHFVECHGAENMRRAGIEVIYMPQWAEEILKINSHLDIK